MPKMMEVPSKRPSSFRILILSSGFPPEAGSPSGLEGNRGWHGGGEGLSSLLIISVKQNSNHRQIIIIIILK